MYIMVVVALGGVNSNRDTLALGNIVLRASDTTTTCYFVTTLTFSKLSRSLGKVQYFILLLDQPLYLRGLFIEPQCLSLAYFRSSCYLVTEICLVRPEKRRRK